MVFRSFKLFFRIAIFSAILFACGHRGTLSTSNDGTSGGDSGGSSDGSTGSSTGGSSGGTSGGGSTGGSTSSFGGAITAESSQNFGEVYVGTKLGNAKQKFTLTNSGSAAFTGLSAGSLSSPFGVYATFPGMGGTCGSSLAAGQSCTFYLTFRPVSSGVATGTFTLSYSVDGVSGSASINLSGTGIKITQITLGSHHACGVMSTGKIYCWGSNQYGVLGDGTTTDSYTPVEVSGISTATQVSTGNSHTCARLSDGTVKCWGSDSSGQLGNGSGAASSTCGGQDCEPSPVTVSGISTATQVSAGNGFTCAVLSDNTIKCWGDNGSGQMGEGGGGATEPTPVSVSGISTATQVEAGGAHACALLSNKTVKCWGDDGNGQLGDDVALSSKNTPVSVSGISTATQIAVNGDTSCALLADSTVQCWGNDNVGQLGDDASLTNQPTPVSVSGINTASSIAVGSQDACAVLSSGVLKCWGRDNRGQLGDDSNTVNQPTPVSALGISTASQVAVGGVTTCALLTDSSVQCWGGESLGTGQPAQIEIPRAKVFGFPMKAIQVAGAMNGTQNCVVFNTGKIGCAGLNDNGQLGNGDAGTNYATFSPVTGISNAVEVSVGALHACALLEDGTVKCWGDDAFGQLGDDSAQVDKSTPVSVSGISTAMSVSAGYRHSCAVLLDGTAKCWGDNSSWQLGHGASSSTSCSGTPCEPTPIAVTGLSSTSQISAGSYNTCATLNDGTVQCWGDDSNGQLGDDVTLASKSTPVAVSGISTAAEVRTGGAFACARLTSGSVKCWGGDSQGSLGDDASLTDQPTPVSVSGISTAIAIGATTGHACAVLSDHTLQCWGDSAYWQLGNNAFVDKTTPFTVPSVSTASTLGLGQTETCLITTDGFVKCMGTEYFGEKGNWTGTLNPWELDVGEGY